MVQAGTGVGSIWNKGNWHWEERNYTDFAKDYLTKRWTSMVVNQADAEIAIYEVKELKGAASVTIRKQKQIFMFEFEGELYWKAKSTKEGDERSNCMGKIKFYEFNQEDDELQTEVTCEAEGNWADGVKRALRNEITQKLLDEAMTLIPAMKAKDIDDEKLARAKQEAKAAAESYKQVSQATGEIKEKIFKDQKQREEEMKQQEAQKPKTAKQINVEQTKIEGQGSVWNAGSYHWEEKSVHLWADTTLKKLISAFQHNMNDTCVSIDEITSLKGESSVAIRKGKKIVHFEYEIKLKWKCVLKDAEGKEVSKCTGNYFIPEICNDDEWSEWEVRLEYTEDKESMRSFADQLLRSFAPKALKQAIQEQFVEEIKKK